MSDEHNIEDEEYGDPTRAYIGLIKWLGEKQFGGMRGWKKKVADKLGISPQHLSKILSGEKKVGWTLVRRAIDATGVDPHFFQYGDQETDPMDHMRWRSQSNARFASVVEDARIILRKSLDGEIPSPKEAQFFIAKAYDSRLAQAIWEASDVAGEPADAVALASTIINEINHLAVMEAQRYKK